MAGAGTDIACASSVVQPSLNPDAGTGVWPEQGRSRESAVTSTQSRWISSANALRNAWGCSLELVGSGRLRERACEACVDGARGSCMARAVVQLNLSL
jgi:hypothetical protein